MSLYGTKLNVRLRAARVVVEARFYGQGSVLAETVQVRCEGIQVKLELESDADPALLAKLARLSEAGCFVIQTIRQPTPTTYAVTVNGLPLDLGT
ncbi:MAG: OsmC family protein [Deltaproteobacteria bacterium]|nr:OsmC family protein [Deltaproteobacteria bacterium]